MKITLFETIFNTYRVINLIGEGGSGRVYKAVDNNNSPFAVKCLNPENISNDKRKRFKNEISFCSKTQHRNVVPVLEYGSININNKNCPFYVMPYYSSTLRDIMKNGVSEEKVIGYFSQILDGVEAAHIKQVWHRDLKPENILYDAITDTLLVADFGVAHFSEEFLRTTLITKPHSRLANFQYSAPEQRIIDGKVSQKTDIFSLGLILNEMFTGNVLQGSGYKTIASVAQNFAYLDEIVEGMVKQSPNDRYTSIDIVKQKLIANKNDFISRQRMSELTNTVITEKEIDDQIVNDPIRITDVDYQSGNLIFNLNRPVNKRWKTSFYNIGNYSYFAGLFEPKLIKFLDSQAFISIPPNTEPDQKMVDMFNSYLKKSNEVYKESLIKEQRLKETNERKRLEEGLEEEKKRQRLRQTLRY